MHPSPPAAAEEAGEEEAGEGEEEAGEGEEEGDEVLMALTAPKNQRSPARGEAERAPSLRG